jgi:hypothetical protein
MTADKLKLGIPMRHLRNELEQDILPLLPVADRDFVRNLYEEAGKKSGGAFAPETTPDDGRRQLFLRRDIPKADRERYWNLLSDAGRMNGRISTVIDIKVPPESIRQDKFEAELVPVLTAEETELFRRIYEPDEFTRSWNLATDDPDLTAQSLAALVRVDYSGAIRHVNQLIDVVVVGTLNAPNPKLNNNTAFIPIDALQDEVGLMLAGKVTELIIREKNAKDDLIPGIHESASVIRVALEAETCPLPPELEIFGWEGYVKDFIVSAAGDNWSTRIMVLILFILAFLGIANTMLLAILERTKEIGMMRAQGMTDGQLIFILMLEAGLVGLAGAMAGMILGCLINIPMVHYGIGYRVNGVFRSAWNIPVIIGTGIAATILAACMAFFSIRRALKMPVTESLRFE